MPDNLSRDIPRRKDIFWAEMAQCNHILQIYDDDAVFLDSLEGFVAGGFRLGEGVIIVATEKHIESLDARLLAEGFDVETLKHQGSYIAVDAHAALAEFMVKDWPDDELFDAMVTRLLERVRHKHSRIRAFGEMVAVLWAKGHNGATVRLEHLWQRMCKSEDFALMCAYPKAGFTEDAVHSMKQICDAHSTMLNS